MSFKDKTQAVTRLFGRSGLKLKQASPTILTIGGVAALITAGVMAVKATSKMEPVVQKLENDLESVRIVKAARAAIHPDDSRNDMREKLAIWGQFSLDFLKVYGPSLAVGAVGASSILYSHGLMKKREASLVAAYGVLDRAYNAYRDRVRESFGEEMEKDIHDGNFVRIVEVDEKNGRIDYESNPSESNNRSDYIFEFGPGNKNWNNARPEWNLVFLRGVEKYTNQLLHARGHVMLNDVLDGLGIDRTKAGAVTGWMRNGADGYIDFGLYQPGTPEEQDYFYFFDGVSPIGLEFNVDGLVYDKLGK